MKLLVHLFLMRLFPAFIVVNASALLGLNYVFPDPDSRFIALVAWCTFTMGFVAVSCIYRNVGSTYFRQLFTKELEDMTLPYLAPQMQNEVRQVLNSHSAISRLAYDAIQLRFGVLLFSCACVIPFLHGFQIPSGWESPNALTTVLLAYTLSMACLSTRKSTLSPKVHRWINRLVSASLSLSVGASVWIISIQSPEHFQHMFLASMSGVLVLLFILMENHLVHRTGVEVSMALHERLNVAKKRR